MKTLRNSLRIAGTTVLASAAFLCAGCLTATYPETYDASDFEEFEFRVDYPSRVYSSSASELGFEITFVCEAIINHESSGEYLLQLTLCTVDPPTRTELPQRAMTMEEAQRFLELSRELAINRHPWPFCDIPTSIGLIHEAFFRWDELELVLIDCDRARLEGADVDSVERFLNTLF